MNTYIVSVVVIKSTSTGFNTQNKLYEISAVSDDEAKGKVLGFISTDFPEHSLHTILTALVTPNAWQQAIDDELVNAHLGIAKDEITREEAKAELNKLIAWHIDAAKYFDSQAQQEPVAYQCISPQGYSLIVETLNGVDQMKAQGFTTVVPLYSSQAQQTESQWMPIETAPKDRSILLYCNKYLPHYVGKQRYGNLGEPQQNEFAWRCDSSGRFATPKFWMPLPPAPEGDDK